MNEIADVRDGGTATMPARAMSSTAGALAPGEAELRRRVIDRVIDLGGEVFAIDVDDGEVELLARLGDPREAGLVAELLLRIGGVRNVSLVLTYLDERPRVMISR